VGLEVNSPPRRSQLCVELSRGFPQSQTLLALMSAQDLGTEELVEIQAASMCLEVNIMDCPIKGLVEQTSRHLQVQG
jgi:hypothetical protein